jgi:hypothetical protein
MFDDLVADTAPPPALPEIIAPSKPSANPSPAAAAPVAVTDQKAVAAVASPAAASLAPTPAAVNGAPSAAAAAAPAPAPAKSAAAALAAGAWEKLETVPIDPNAVATVLKEYESWFDVSQLLFHRLHLSSLFSISSLSQCCCACDVCVRVCVSL